ncbi:uncharacterized protein EAF02_000607 [Botrytis sinoallii]|uniref:uncharacterized protein n=1 Tax=Botrytis sinoallii TaxID=1463999 RepID=UPI001901765C|nr:uncharacterized protein EAF02_000607 [Botrytis sinoallii]KAF7893069.1 hypothetical protein EAF02_000607 [Botrytis sinoallii]
MSNKYDVHHTFDSREEYQRPITSADISDYIPLQPGRENINEPTPFDVLNWLSVFYGQKVPPLPVIRARDLEEVPDQRLQETLEEYQLFTPTVRGVKLNPFTEIGIEGFPLIEDTRFNIVRSYPADEQYQGPHNLIWLVSNSYWRAVAWAIYGNWELWPHSASGFPTARFDTTTSSRSPPTSTASSSFIFTCRPAGQALNIPGFGSDQNPRHFAADHPRGVQPPAQIHPALHRHRAREIQTVSRREPAAPLADVRANDAQHAEFAPLGFQIHTSDI